MKSVTFFSKQVTEILLSPGNVISLLDPGEEVRYLIEPKSLLAIRCHDVEEHLPGYTLFSMKDAKSIMAFAKECGEEDVIIHCHAGLSRSAAVAKFFSEELGYRLNLASPCVGYLDRYNGHIYGMLRRLKADTILEHVAELELADRQRGTPWF